MIAAVKGCRAILSALLFLMLPAANAADDLNGAARELARKTAIYGRVDAAAVVWRNVSSLGSAELAQARAAFEAALGEAGSRGNSAPQLSVRITLSQNPTQYLLVEEAQSADERQVWISGWKRAAAPRNGVPGMSLESKLAWEQDEPILDAALVGDGMLVLSPWKVTLHARGGDQSADLAPSKPWPRDLRGHLRITAAGFRVNLPGMSCNGTFEPALTVDCRPADEPWTLDSGTRGILLASFTPARNFFDGRLVTPTGARKTVSPFYAAAAVEDQGRPHWLFALVDGRTQILDGAFDPVGAIGPWGSDLAATEARCSGGTQVIATKAGDAREPDTVRAWSLVNRAPVALTPPMELPGPVTALWSLGGASVLAVVRDLATARYSAYLITVVCGA